MSSDPIFEPLRNLLNRQIERSTPARQAVAELEGRTLAIRLRNTGLSIFLSVADGRLELRREFPAEPDVLLETTPIGLAELARGTMAGGRVGMTGDPVIAQHFQALLQNTRPDWEEELSQIVGDVAAHQVGKLVRGVMAFGQRAFDSVSRSAAEFITEERRDVAAPGEIDHFRERVASVSDQVEALTRRVENLFSRTR